MWSSGSYSIILVCLCVSKILMLLRVVVEVIQTGNLRHPVFVATTEKETREKLVQYGVLSQLGFNIVD